MYTDFDMEFLASTSCAWPPVVFISCVLLRVVYLAMYGHTDGQYFLEGTVDLAEICV